MIQRKTPLKRSKKPIARKTPLRRSGMPIKRKPVTSSEHKKMHDFYIEQAMHVPLRCQNCDALLNVRTFDQIRSVSAHILPKSTFKSVATHQKNLIFLGTLIAGSDCSCHDNWDRKDAADRKSMKCYDLAISRVKELYPELSMHEQVKAEKYLGIMFSFDIPL